MSTVIIGIGNLLMGDEGVGVHVVRHIQEHDLAPNLECIDGGTGGFHLLDYFRKNDRVIMIDATIDGQPAGSIARLTPKYSFDFPPTLTAHDIGLKDLIDALFLLDQAPEIVLFTVSIDEVAGVGLDLTDDVAAAVPAAANTVAVFLSENPAPST